VPLGGFFEDPNGIPIELLEPREAPKSEEAKT
jgi:hypothetical protein